MSKKDKKQEECRYCHGAGIDADLFDMGMRRVIGKDADSQRVWAQTRKYRCDRCGKPKSLPAPGDGVLITSGTKGVAQAE